MIGRVDLLQTDFLNVLLALLLAEFMAARAREAPGLPIEVAVLEARTMELIQEHRAHWRKDVTLPGAEVELTRQTLERLDALRLIRRFPEGIVPRPAIARFGLTDPTFTREP